MKAIKYALVALLVAGLGTTALAEEKQGDNKKLLIGKWKAAKVQADSLPVGTIVEFTADGKMKMTAKFGDQEMIFEGTYTVEADSFTLALKTGDTESKKKIQIKKLDDKVLNTVGDSGKAVDFKRVK